MNKKLIGFASVLIVFTSQTAFSAQKNALNMSESEIIDLLNGKIEKVQAKQHKIIKQQKNNTAQRQLINQQPLQRKRVVAPKTVSPPVKAPAKRVNLSSIPAWRRPASPTMTRSSDDALFGAAKTRNMSLLRQLIGEGANVNHQNFNGETALHIAASLGNLQMVQYLISQGANVNAKTGTSWMPIHHAMRFGYPRVAQLLISHKASLSGKTIDGFTALDFAKKSKNPQIQSLAKKYGY
ncbi:MAG TPA: ankyrin repeat domain-containing protein [Leucothrix mucor]|uniref:Ankyrin repeat domain-containing protein n=1 Tax=Leucothrix mucor TaxID=45248 RepID=A0A7V2T0A0_LEUMU|nr:ankyrin repeat domain-containing protein [Leucothrix mucor]